MAPAMVTAFTAAKIRATQGWYEPRARQPKVSPKARSPMRSKVAQLSQVLMSTTSVVDGSAVDEPARSRSLLIKRSIFACIKGSCSRSALSEKTGLSSRLRRGWSASSAAKTSGCPLM